MRNNNILSYLFYSGTILYFSGICISCNDTGGGVYTPGQGNIVPVISAGNDTAVDVYGSLYLHAAGSDEDGSIIAWQWIVLHNEDTLAVLDTNTATYKVPLFPGDSLLCIALAYDDSGGIGKDSIRVYLLSWIIYPNGGDTLSIGDSVTIQLRETYETVGLAIIADDGEYILPVPGLNESIIPGLQPNISFIMPDSIYDSPSQSYVALGGKCCKLRVFRYMAQYEFVESEFCFYIAQSQLKVQPPIAHASGDTIVQPYSIISLYGNGIADQGVIVSYEWLIKGQLEFIEVNNGDTSIIAPGVFDSSYICILRVTDERNAVGLDTLRIIVSWLKSPNGGEFYRIGDTARVELFEVEELVTLKLIVYRDGDYAELGLPGINNMIWPPTESIITFIVPDSLNDALFGRISMVSDSCRIRVLRYSEPTYFVESAGYFSIVP